MIRIRKSSIYYAIIFITLMMNLNIFFLVDVYGSFKILGIPLFDITFIWNILWILYTIVCNLNLRINKYEKSFLRIILFSLVLVVTSAYMATITYDQPFLYGILAQRLWISFLFMYFPFSYWLKKNYITSRGIIKTLKVFSFIYIIICILQYILGETIQFTYVDSSIRYGDSRFAFDCLYLILLSSFLLDNILSSRKIKRIDLILMGGVFFVLVIVTKGRMQMISWAVSSVLCVIMHKKLNIQKFLALIIIIIGIFVVASSSIGADILDILFGTGKGIGLDTLTIRDMSRDYYLNLLTTDNFTLTFGYGIASSSWEIAMNIARPTIGYWTYYTADNGIFGSAFYYGLLGVMWWIITMGYFFYLSLIVYKKTGKTAYMQIVIIDILAAPTLVPYLFNSISIITLYMVLLQNEVLQIKKVER